MSARQYELVYIIAPDATEQEVTDLHTQVEGIVTRLNGTLEKSEPWGRRKLAYEIGPHKEGIYVLEQFTGGPDVVKELDRRLKVLDRVIRHLVVRDRRGVGDRRTPQERRGRPRARGAVRRAGCRRFPSRAPSPSPRRRPRPTRQPAGGGVVMAENTNSMGPGSGGGSVDRGGGGVARRARRRRPWRGGRQGRRVAACSAGVACASSASRRSTCISYKDVKLLSGFIPERGKIQPRRLSGTCAAHQRKLQTAISRARQLALIPYITD